MDLSKLCNLLFSAFFLFGTQKTVSATEAELPTVDQIKDANKDVFHNAVDKAGVVMSRPCAVSWGPGRLDSFHRGLDSAVYHIYRIGDEWSVPWGQLGGVIIDEIECISRGEGLLDVFVLGTDSAVHRNSYDGSGWTGWIRIQSIWAEAPSCVVTEKGKRVDCFGRGRGDSTWMFSYSDGKWSDHDISHPDRKQFRYGFGCTHWQDRPYCYGIDYDGTLWGTGLQQNGEWSYYYEVETAKAKGRPLAINYDDSRLDVFFVGMDNLVRDKPWEYGWFDEELVGLLRVESVPACVTNEPGVIYCYGVGTLGTINVNVRDGEKWGEWVDLQQTALESPSCGKTDELQLTCNWRGGHYQLMFDDFSL